MTKSRTMIAMAMMAALEGAAASMHYWQGIMEVETFALISTLIGTVTPVLAMYLRTITTEPLSARK